MSNTQFTALITATRIATLGKIISDMGLDGPDDNLQEYLSRLDAIGTSIDDLAQQIVTLFDNLPLGAVGDDTEVAS